MSHLLSCKQLMYRTSIMNQVLSKCQKYSLKDMYLPIFCFKVQPET